MSSAKKWLGWTIIIGIIVYLILDSPEWTAEWFRDVIAGIQDAASAIATFVRGLWS